LGLAGTAALSAAAIGTTSSSAFAKVAWAKVLAVVSTVGAVGAVPVGYYALRESEAPVLAAVHTPRVAATSPAARTLPSEAMPLPAAPPPSAPAAALPRAPRAEAKAVLSSADLTAELAAIDGARSALTGGDASGALSQLDAYSRTYPRGRLLLEAEVLRIDALARSGQREAAKRRAELFVQRYPKSVLKARVRGYLTE
jgi:hypothetical protein